MVSSFTTLKAIASILSIATITNAHMVMFRPIPYGRGSISNAPLAADGSDYPCKSIFDMTDPVNDVNHLVPGVPNTLSFTGGATHGGGSCQVSLTNDLKPTKNSKWMVIKSIEGGCPNSAPGNFGNDASAHDPTEFSYTVPEGFPEGQYTIAWTWFNKIGNREMYMNCGRANIANSKKRYAPPKPKVEHRAADYPDIMKGNLAIFPDCKVPEGIDVKFPNGGPDVQSNVVAPTLPNGCGSGSGGSSPNPVSGGSSAPAVSSSAIAGATASRVASSPVASASAPAQTGGFAHGSNPTSSPTASPGNFAPVPSSSSAAAAANTPSASASVIPIPPAQSAPSASSVAPAQPTPSSSSGGSTDSPTTSTGATTAGTKCSEEGAWACSSDGTSFQRCASGVWSASMKVAAGTTCVPGQSMNLSMKVVGGGYKKRSFSHPRSKQLSE